MSEDNIIRQERPHEVTIPDGSHMAVAKTAVQQEASVRKVYDHAGGEDVEHIAPDKFVSDQTEALQGAPDRFVGDQGGMNNRGADALPPPVQARGPSTLEVPPEHRVTIPPTVAPPAVSARETATLPAAGHLTSSEAAKPAQALAAASESSHVEPRKPVATGAMPEMDFPARVVHLHIENENLRKRLDALDADR